MLWQFVRQLGFLRCLPTPTPVGFTFVAEGSDVGTILGSAVTQGGIRMDDGCGTECCWMERRRTAVAEDGP